MRLGHRAGADGAGDALVRPRGERVPAHFDTLAVRGARLSAALSVLAATPTDAKLTAAQAAWRDMRQPYERGEAWAFGPIATGGYDPNMDTWPVDINGIDALLASDDVLNRATIDGLDGTLKGFHGIEYLLFGLHDDATAGQFTTRDLLYLDAAGKSLAASAAGLRAAWSPSGESFGTQLAAAGQAGSVYSSLAAGIQDVVSGLVGPTDEVPNEKIANALTGGSAYEESRFSDNTLSDLLNDRWCATGVSGR